MTYYIVAVSMTGSEFWRVEAEDAAQARELYREGEKVYTEVDDREVVYVDEEEDE